MKWQQCMVCVCVGHQVLLSSMRCDCDCGPSVGYLHICFDFLPIYRCIHLWFIKIKQDWIQKELLKLSVYELFFIDHAKQSDQ